MYPGICTQVIIIFFILITRSNLDISDDVQMSTSFLNEQGKEVTSRAMTPLKTVQMLEVECLFLHLFGSHVHVILKELRRNDGHLYECLIIVLS